MFGARSVAKKMSEMEHLRRLHREISHWLDELRLSNATEVEIIHSIEGRIKVETDETAIHLLKSNLAREYNKQANETAADSLYREFLPEVDDWYRKLRRTNGTAHDKTTKAIEDRIRAHPHAPEIDDLYQMLAGEYSALGNFAAAERIEWRLADKNPDDPLPLNALASNKCSLQDQPEEAMALINRALEVAQRT